MLLTESAHPAIPRHYNVVSHAGFLVRRAWRAKIAVDAESLRDQPVDLQGRVLRQVAQRFVFAKDRGVRHGQ